MNLKQSKTNKVESRNSTFFILKIVFAESKGFGHGSQASLSRFARRSLSSPTRPRRCSLCSHIASGFQIPLFIFSKQKTRSSSGFLFGGE
ncbi:hypothetical protein CVU82_01175 [Candidatus Falkowbacteria bacterium HGW-Falkowbacteria-1]|uniref:Uncharacterized protein n=1 Tax=Candidatus Falkowbacteria bacterium HGW-Falkowbacteria-1 TaxID=2013768 RepID=A0A2N2EAW1_9BACT|nr:MAG: hypothetical protein CVU82_01175 [Candidatus Falkowbacteria bacterium HGW-Falkowbacteria-1]